MSNTVYRHQELLIHRLSCENQFLVYLFIYNIVVVVESTVSCLNFAHLME